MSFGLPHGNYELRALASGGLQAPRRATQRFVAFVVLTRLNCLPFIRAKSPLTTDVACFIVKLGKAIWFRGSGHLPVLALLPYPKRPSFRSTLVMASGLAFVGHPGPSFLRLGENPNNLYLIP